MKREPGGTAGTRRSEAAQRGETIPGVLRPGEGTPAEEARDQPPQKTPG